MSVTGWRGREGFFGASAAGFFWAVVLLVTPGPGWALGTLDLWVTGGPGGYGEWEGRLRLDPWKAVGGEVEVAFSNADGSSATRYYRAEIGVLTPVGFEIDVGASRSPAADDLRSEAVYVDFTVTGSPWTDRMTAVTGTWQRRVYGVRPLRRWEDVEQVSWGVWAAQELSIRWVATAEYTGYAYDRDLDRAALALEQLEFSRRARDVGFTVDRLVLFPDRTWGFGFDYRHPSGWRAGASWTRIDTAVEALEADTDRYGLETGWEFETGLGTSLGLDAYVDRNGTEAYPYFHLYYDF